VICCAWLVNVTARGRVNWSEGMSDGVIIMSDVRRMVIVIARRCAFRLPSCVRMMWMIEPSKRVEITRRVNNPFGACGPGSRRTTTAATARSGRVIRSPRRSQASVTDLESGMDWVIAIPRVRRMSTSARASDIGDRVGGGMRESSYEL